MLCLECTDALPPTQRRASVSKPLITTLSLTQVMNGTGNAGALGTSGSESDGGGGGGGHGNHGPPTIAQGQKHDMMHQILGLAPTAAASSGQNGGGQLTSRQGSHQRSPSQTKAIGASGVLTLPGMRARSPTLEDSARARGSKKGV